MLSEIKCFLSLWEQNFDQISDQQISGPLSKLVDQSGPLILIGSVALLNAPYVGLGALSWDFAPKSGFWWYRRRCTPQRMFPRYQLPLIMIRMITNTVNSGQNCKIQLIRFFGDVSRKTGNGFSDVLANATRSVQNCGS